MTYYLYLFDAQAVIVQRVDLGDCRDDGHARDVAAAYRCKGGIELWQADRLVERFDSFAALPERAVYKVDQDLRFVFANEVALDYWGRTAAEVLGRTLAEAFPAAVGSKSYRAHIDTLLRRRPFHAALRSPVLDEAIDLQIYPDEGGLRVSFLKVAAALADRQAGPR